MMIALTFGSARGSEGISVPAADWRAAKSLLRSNMESRVLMIVLNWSYFRTHESVPSSYDYSFAGGHQQSIGLSGGLLIGIP
jgi:hypothetical protein